MAPSSPDMENPPPERSGKVDVDITRGRATVLETDHGRKADLAANRGTSKDAKADYVGKVDVGRNQSHSTVTATTQPAGNTQQPGSQIALAAPPTGLYEQLITDLLAQRLETLPTGTYHIQTHPVEPLEAARYLTQHVSAILHYALSAIPASQRPLGQIDLANNIIRLLARAINDSDLHGDLIHTEGRLLEAVLNRLHHPHADMKARIREIMPHTRLSQSELFTGNRAGVSLESEINKEIASSDEICWLVSFIKFSGISTLMPALREFTRRGNLRIITTSYMGATDAKAVNVLARLPNTQIKVSYNPEHERLHAKAYLFLRNSGFHTGYIGSSNLSRSALTNGLEWNMKITTREVAHIIDKFRKTFDTYWADSEFDLYDVDRDGDRLQRALTQQRMRSTGNTGDQTGPGGAITTFFEVRPYAFQQEILDKLYAERTLHHRTRNLVVAATGTGKTVISAFDFKRYRAAHPEARLLFIAHRKEILHQSRTTFRHILRDGNFGEIWVDGATPERFECVFASVQTFNSQQDRLAHLPADYFDMVIIDEVHHLTAASYRTVLERFQPDVLLGLTATPERMDGGDITEDFDGRIAAEIRLPEALNRKLLCPFQYFGVTDAVDLRDVAWKNGKYDAAALTRIYTAGDMVARQRVQSIMDALEQYCTDPAGVRALGFCVTKDHARYMSDAFQQAGFKADVLVGETPREERDAMRARLQRGELNYLFVVDVFNEGVDIPEIDTVLFLRPTESLTVFLQQLGRGLRLADGKDVLTVLDFVGNAREEYDFEHKFRALIGRTRQSVLKELEHDFPHLPLGCSIVLERQAREYILENIRRATSLKRPKMVQKIQGFRHQSDRPLTWLNFMEFHHMEAPMLYKFKMGGKLIGWNRLCVEAGVRDDFREPLEVELSRYIGTRLLTTQSESYFRFVLALLDAGCDVGVLLEDKYSQNVNMNNRDNQNINSQFVNIDSTSNRLKSSHIVNTSTTGSQPKRSHNVNIDTYSSQLKSSQNVNILSAAEIEQFALMLHYDIWQTDGPSSGAANLRESLLRLNDNLVMLNEIREVTRYLLDQLDVIEKPTNNIADFPLRIHGRYNRDQILVAMQMHTWEKASFTQAGVAENRELGAEALFVTLNKNEEDYSSSTMYEDYAISENIFHWQSQNASRPERGRGLSYIQHKDNGKQMLMFVREHNNDTYGNTMSYVFLGPCDYIDHSGAKPMNIKWNLHEPIPGYLLNESRKLAAG